MKLNRLLFFVMFVMCASFLQAQQIDCPSLFEMGEKLYAQEKYAEATKIFNTITNGCGQFDQALLNKANEYLKSCDISVSLSKRELDFNAEGKEVVKTTASSHAKRIKKGSHPVWCHVTIDNKTISVWCDDNLTGSQRSATIAIEPIDNSKDQSKNENASQRKPAYLKIIQSSIQPEMSFDPNPVLLNSNADTTVVTVTANVLEWSVDSTVFWLKTEKRHDSLVLMCSDNSSHYARNAEVTVIALGQRFSLQVRQLPGDTLVKVGLAELLVPQEGAVEEIGVTCSRDGWDAKVSDSTWMKIKKSKKSVTLALEKNPTVFSRQGTVTVWIGSRSQKITVRQQPKVSEFNMPASELDYLSKSDGKVVSVTSFPSDLKVYFDDVITKMTPFNYDVDYKHHSVQVGFERREFLFNEEQAISFTPGLRFANITFTSPRNIGLRTGFVSANELGAYSHFQASRPLVSEFVADSVGYDGYHFLVGPVYQPIPYLGAYAGLGFGLYNGSALIGQPRINWDIEAGVMGFYKNVMLSMGFRTSKLNSNDKSTTFVLGVGGYLKRYYDKDLGYCSSDSRRWWSVNYMWRPAQNGQGLMLADLGKNRTRFYIKAMYLQPDDTVKDVSGTLGFLLTPVDGIIDVCMGLGVDANVAGGNSSYYHPEAELGFILNLWRVPVTVMLHESDLFYNPHLFVDFGVGFHLGEFNKSSYK